MMGELIDIAGMDKAVVLAALYNASHAQGMGMIHYDPQPMTREQAAKIVAQNTYGGVVERFEYIKGRVMKVDLSGDTLDPWLYDRDNGPGAAAKAIVSAQQERDSLLPAFFGPDGSLRVVACGGKPQ